MPTTDIPRSSVSGVRVEILAPTRGWRRRKPLRLTARVFLQIAGKDAVAYQAKTLAAGESLTVNLPDPVVELAPRKTPPVEP